MVALEVAIVLLLPLVLGYGLGWYDLNPPQAEALSPVGTDAHELLNNFPDGHLVLEFDYQSSVGPPPASALAVLEDRVNETCGKQSITVEEFPFSSPATSFSEGTLLGLEDSVQHTWSSPGTVVLDYLYVNGGDADNPNALGLAYRGASIAVFEATIVAASPSEATAITTTVLIHEFGHELGLVGVVGSAPNEDPNHPYHSSDPNDVMYWAVDTTAILGGLLGTAPPTQFDAADLSDLATVRSTVIPQDVLPWGVVAASLAGALLFVWWERRHRGESAESPP